MLTIDDGPSENTPAVLERLKEYGLKAVFFCTGANIEKYPDQFQAIIKDGHSIQNHGFGHFKMIFKGYKYSFGDIKKCSDLISSRTNLQPTLFRPPYGWFDPAVSKAVSANRMKMMLWSFLTGDHTGDLPTVKRLTDTYLSRNSIVVMHDNNKSAPLFRDSLEYLLNAAEKKKYPVS